MPQEACLLLSIREQQQQQTECFAAFWRPRAHPLAPAAPTSARWRMAQCGVVAKANRTSHPWIISGGVQAASEALFAPTSVPSYIT